MCVCVASGEQGSLRSSPTGDGETMANMEASGQYNEGAPLIVIPDDDITGEDAEVSGAFSGRVLHCN